MRSVVLCLLLAFQLGCSGERAVGPTVGVSADGRLARLAGLGAMLQILPQDQILELPTYDGSGQAVHPDVAYVAMPDRAPRFYMSMTPYPDSRGRFENPSILVSADGLRFGPTAPGVNPLVGPPQRDHNDDPDLVVADGRLLIYYLQTCRPDSQDVVRLSSADGVSWSRRTVLHFNLAAKEAFIVSPAVVRTSLGYRLFYVNLSERSHPVEWLASQDGKAWNKRARGRITADLPAALIPWHLDVFGAEGRYYMLVCGPYSACDLYLGWSADLETWYFRQEPILRRSAAFHHSKTLYRSSGLVDGDVLGVWYSLQDLDGRWSIGFHRFSLRALGLSPAPGA